MEHVQKREVEQRLKIAKRTYNSQIPQKREIFESKKNQRKVLTELSFDIICNKQVVFRASSQNGFGS
jgi:hypothetical protein